MVLEVWGRDKVTTQEKVQASGIAGGLSGAAGGLLRKNQSTPSGSPFSKTALTNSPARWA